MIAPLEWVFFGVFTSLAFLVGRRWLAGAQRVSERGSAVSPKMALVPERLATYGPPVRPSLTLRIDRWWATILGRAGMRYDRSVVTVTIACLAATVGLLSASCGLSVPVSLGASCAAFVVFGTLVYAMMLRRVARFRRQFPSSLELMARATRAGANFESAVRVALEASEEPLRSEFTQCVHQIQLGLTSAQVATDLAERIGTPDLQLFAHTISTHGQVGGRLAASLEKLSAIIRERAELGEKIRAATAIARLAILTVIVMAVFVLIYLQFAQPDYLQKLVSSDFGQKLIIYAVVSECVGLIWVAVTLRLEY